MSSAAEYVAHLAVWFDSARSDEGSGAGDAAYYNDLLARVRGGDNAAFDALVLALAAPLTAYAKRLTGSFDTAQDVVQDVFAAVWEHRGTLHIRGGGRGYFYTAIRNRVLDLRKHERYEAPAWSDAARDAAPRIASASDAADAALYRQEVAERVAAALSALSPRARETALLRWHDGLSRPEIAAIMGVSVATVNNQLTAAARIVRALLADLRADV